MAVGGKSPIEEDLDRIRRHLRQNREKVARALHGAGAVWRAQQDQIKRDIAAPLLDILGPSWMLEEEALACLSLRGLDGLRVAYAVDLGLAERRIRGWPWNRHWHIRLTRKGWQDESDRELMR